MTLLRICLALWVGAAMPAHAHDTWFAPLGAPSAGARLLALGTGNRYPVQELPIGHEQLVQRGCAGAGGAAATLSAVQQTASALLLRAAPSPRGAAPAGAMSCWAQLVPFEVEIEADIVERYLDEVHAEPGVRARWAAQKARGVQWHERYVKHARVELAGAGQAPADAASPMAFDLRLDPAEGPLRAGSERGFTLRRDGRAQPGQWLELVDARGASGGWARTDSEGRVRFAVPAPGRWLVRGTALEPDAAAPDRWRGDFVTIAFEVP